MTLYRGEVFCVFLSTGDFHTAIITAIRSHHGINIHPDSQVYLMSPMSKLEVIFATMGVTRTREWRDWLWQMTSSEPDIVVNDVPLQWKEIKLLVKKYYDKYPSH